MNQKSRKIGIILTILIISNIIFSGCINSPTTEDEKPTLNNDNNEEIPEGMENNNKTYLEEISIKNEGILEEQEENNSEILENIEDINETNSMDQEDNNTTFLEGLENVIEANNHFAFKLYLELIKNNNKNIFYSPLSISTALGITYEGARSKTAQEIQSIFQFPLDNDSRRKEFLEIYNEINKENKKYQLNLANALWAERNYKFLDEYFSIIKKYYGGNVTNLDFQNDPEGSRKIINGWVEDQTNDKIKDLIPSGVINYLTRLVITNAIYFKGNWKIQFDEKDTSEQDFYINADKSVKVPMMYLKDSFNYVKTEEIQILELPYEGNDLSMLILLPNDNNLSSVENSINTKNLTAWKNNLTKRTINIYIPKFKFETKYFLKETFKKMGMEIPFSDLADFSGMDGSKYLYIASVIHQAFVKVNEEGTEAAAATAVVVNTFSIDNTPVFRANHPFIFLIQDKASGNILFMGRVVDPSV